MRYEKNDDKPTQATADYLRRIIRPSSHVQVRDTSSPVHLYDVRKPKILLVEDNALILRINRFYLLSLGCDVLTAGTGQLAIDMCHDQFDLMILDIGLPDISGVEVAKQFRATALHRETPIIALTALSCDIIQPCLEAGMNQVLQKPLPINEMYRLLYDQLPRFRNTLEHHWQEGQKK